MSLQPVEAYSTNTRTGRPRCRANRIRSKSFAAGTGTLAILSAVTRSVATGLWSLWAAVVSEIGVITKSGTYTGGTFTITVDGATTAAIAWNAANAVILAALNALPNVSPGDVVLTGGGAAGVSTGALTLTFGGKLAGRAIVVSTDATLITGGGANAYVTSTAGVESGGNTGTDKIKGFVWPDAIVLAAGGEVIGNVLMEGTVHRDDVPLNGVTQPNLDAALKDEFLRQNDIIIEGLAGA